MKIVYIAHPVSGNIKENVDRIISIVRFINLTMPDIIPFAPYIVDCLALDDINELERDRGIKNDVALLKAGFISEMWLYGDRISVGMKNEIEIAKKMKIKVVSKSEGTKEP